MMGSRVNAHVARDLTSNAGSRVADMNDFRGTREQNAADFEKGKTLLSQRGGDAGRADDDLRSMKSEYDYGSKKKFLDVLGNVSAATKLNRLRAQHDMDRASAKGAASIKSSKISRVSYKSKASARSGVRAGESNLEAHPTPIEEEGPGDDDEEELEARPEDFVNCNNCLRALTEDEKIINARFVNEAMAASRDISLFPICIACNFE